jgi:prepilin-type N-terminal cleavage/methylation domain-containing protein
MRVRASANRVRLTVASYRGFTMIEVLIATALLAFSLAVMFGFHSQAVRSNRNARKVTDCTYLAQGKLEELMSLPWDSSTGRPTALTDGANTDTEWGDLYHSDNGPGSSPSAVNPLWETSPAAGNLPATYYVTWDVETMNSASTWIRIRVRCSYEDKAFSSWNGTTLSAYRYQDI